MQLSLRVQAFLHANWCTRFFSHESQADCIWSVSYCMLFKIGPNKSHVISTLGIKIIEKCNVKFLNSDLRVSITKYAD